MRFKDRVAVVTGSGRGIGKTIAKKLFDDGAKVAIVDLNESDAQEARRHICDGGPPEAAERVAGFACDVSDPAAVQALFASVKDRFNQLDILVNNAGVTRDNLFMRMSFEQWKKVIDVNLTGTFLCSRHAIMMLRKSPCGRIINISSVAAGGNPGQANYAASKAGIIGLTRTLALELARYKVTANVVTPGFIDTDMTKSIPDQVREQWMARIPVGRVGTADDVADTVVFLASDDAAYITGESITVDGGIRMGNQ